MVSPDSSTQSTISINSPATNSRNVTLRSRKGCQTPSLRTVPKCGRSRKEAFQRFAQQHRSPPLTLGVDRQIAARGRRAEQSGFELCLGQLFLRFGVPLLFLDTRAFQPAVVDEGEDTR